MSDNDNSTAAAANGTAPKFSERELQLLGWAMQSLKSGPPEIDYEKLANFASMSNPRSASNAWARIKAKLATSSPDGVVPPTPKKGRAKKAAPENDNDEEGAATPKKTPRKRPAKKQEVDGDASPKKKGRGKKASDDDSVNVKAESDASDDLKPSDSPMKVDPADVEDEV